VGEGTESGPEPDTPSHQDGLTENTKSALQEHNISITESGDQESRSTVTVDALSDDLQAVVRAWNDLPEAVRRGIMAMIDTSRGD